MPTPQPGTAVATSSAITHHARAWQEDARFGLVLILTLAAVNLLLIQLMSFLPAKKAHDENGGAVLFGSSSMPQAVKGESSDITVYADPDAHRRLANEFDLNRIDPEQNELSVSPRDIPAPRARALDKPGQ